MEHFIENNVFYFCISFIAILGLVVGSFLAACAYRIPRKIKISCGRSMCPECKYTLKWYDLVPVFSYLILKGKCRYCTTRISLRYPAIEFLNALFWVIIFLKYRLTIEALIYAVVASCLLLLSVIDIGHMIIPDRTIVIILAAGIMLTILRLPEDLKVLSRIIGFFVVSIPFYIIALLKSDGMGGGDIKLMAVSGFLLGWKGILIALVLGSCSGAVYGVSVLIRRKKKRNDQVPFGPFLSAGILVSLLFGTEILAWYLGFV